MVARVAAVSVIAVIAAAALASVGPTAVVPGNRTVSCPRLAPNVFLNFARHEGDSFDYFPLPVVSRGGYTAAVQTRGGGVSRPAGVATYGFATASTRWVDQLCKPGRVPKKRTAKLSPRYVYRTAKDGRWYWETRAGDVEYTGRYNCVVGGRIVVSVSRIRQGRTTVGSRLEAFTSKGFQLAVAELRAQGKGDSWYRYAQLCWSVP